MLTYVVLHFKYKNVLIITLVLVAALAMSLTM